MFGKPYFCETEIDFILKETARIQVNGLYINHDINTISFNEYC